jgi:hypothetical protein
MHASSQSIPGKRTVELDMGAVVSGLCDGRNLGAVPKLLDAELGTAVVATKFYSLDNEYVSK